MKKILAILLASLMVLSLFACNNASNASSSPSASPSTEPSATESAAASTDSKPAEAVEVGWYDPSIDYKSAERYKVVYMMSATGSLYDDFSKAFAKWAERLNCDYSDFCSNGDNDLYLTTMETFATQGVKGLLLDPDSTIYPRVIEVADELNINWMGCMAPARDTDGKLAHPSVGFDHFDFGVQMANWVIEYAKKTWPSAKPEEIGMLSIDFSVVPPIHLRTEGEKSVWDKTYPNLPNNFFVADCATEGKMTFDIAYNLSAATFAANPNIKYWLICGAADDLADGAARAVAAAGKADNAVATTAGGSSLVQHWDAGDVTAWKSAIYTAQALFAEPIFNALYAFMSGKATPETIWPEWVNKAAGNKYASLLLPTYTITEDTYKEYLEWVDNYTGFNQYNYEYKGTTFTVKAEVPASYAG